MTMTATDDMTSTNSETTSRGNEMTTIKNGLWDPTVWAAMDDAVNEAVCSIRVARRVFPPIQLAGVNSVPADIFDPERMSIEEGVQRPYIELSVEFPLTNGQVYADPEGTTVITLAKFAARSLALAEDLIIFQGKRAQLPQGVRIESGKEARGEGIVDLASTVVTVKPPPKAIGFSGAEILAAVQIGIAKLQDEHHGQAWPFALIEDINAYAHTAGSLIGETLTDKALCQFLTMGIHLAGGMPPNTGLLVALGGDPNVIYFSDAPTTQHTHQDGTGRHFMRTFERFQYVARDPRAFVKLDFSYLEHPDYGGGMDYEARDSALAGRRTDRPGEPEHEQATRRARQGHAHSDPPPAASDVTLPTRSRERPKKDGVKVEGGERAMEA